jgi:protein SCO1
MSIPLPRSARVLLSIGFSALALAGVAALQLANAGYPRFHGTAYPDAPAAPIFVLTDHRGQPATLVEQRGRVVLLFFGFTRCPDVCPLTLTRLARVLDGAGIGPDRARILLVSVDPEHDTPERLAEYAGRFGPSVTGLTGQREDLERIFAEYGVHAGTSLDHHGRETIAHTSVVFGIDPRGRLRVLIHADEPDDVVERDVRWLLRLTR